MLCHSDFEGFDLQSMGVAAPRMRAEFMLDNAQMAWAFSAAILGTLPGAILGGRFADIVGRKKILILVSYFWNYVFANRLCRQF